MPKKAKELTDAAVRNIKHPGTHPVGGVAGLCLKVSKTGARSWILRYSTGEQRTSQAGKPFNVRRDAGLGPYPDVKLGAARDRARKLREKLFEGTDPVQERKANKAKLAASRGNIITFDEAAAKFLAMKTKEFRNPKHAAQWAATLEKYASPVIGNMSVADIELAHILRLLEPEWTTKTETMKRVRGRVEQVIAWAVVKKYRKSGMNPASWKGNLDKVLQQPSKVSKVVHHSAMPWREIPDFSPLLRERTGIAARALEFLILTAARSGEIRGALWSEINPTDKTWHIPAERMKAGKEHVVPLSDAAIALLESLPRIDGSPYLFPAPRGGVLSDMSISAVCRRMKVDAVPHGFRSTFRDWAADETHYQNIVCEMALAHTITSEAEKAYRRGDLLKKRRDLMQDWADFINGVDHG